MHRTIFISACVHIYRHTSGVLQIYNLVSVAIRARRLQSRRQRDCPSKGNTRTFKRHFSSGSWFFPKIIIVFLGYCGFHRKCTHIQCVTIAWLPSERVLTNQVAISFSIWVSTRVLAVFFQVHHSIHILVPALGLSCSTNTVGFYLHEYLLSISSCPTHDFCRWTGSTLFWTNIDLIQSCKDSVVSEISLGATSCDSHHIKKRKRLCYRYHRSVVLWHGESRMTSGLVEFWAVLEVCRLRQIARWFLSHEITKKLSVNFFLRVCSFGTLTFWWVLNEALLMTHSSHVVQGYHTTSSILIDVHALAYLKIRPCPSGYLWSCCILQLDI